jgi:hypothetical protein
MITAEAPQENDTREPKPAVPADYESGGQEFESLRRAKPTINEITTLIVAVTGLVMVPIPDHPQIRASPSLLARQFCLKRLSGSRFGVRSLRRRACAQWRSRHIWPTAVTARAVFVNFGDGGGQLGHGLIGIATLAHRHHFGSRRNLFIVRPVCAASRTPRRLEPCCPGRQT